MVHLDVEEIWWADRAAVLIRHLIGEASQGQPTDLAGLPNDIASSQSNHLPSLCSNWQML
jgi:hypothetical protein